MSLAERLGSLQNEAPRSTDVDMEQFKPRLLEKKMLWNSLWDSRLQSFADNPSEWTRETIVMLAKQFFVPQHQTTRFVVEFLRRGDIDGIMDILSSFPHLSESDLILIAKQALSGHLATVDDDQKRACADFEKLTPHDHLLMKVVKRNATEYLLQSALVNAWSSREINRFLHFLSGTISLRMEYEALPHVTDELPELQNIFSWASALIDGNLGLIIQNEECHSGMLEFATNTLQLKEEYYQPARSIHALISQLQYAMKMKTNEATQKSAARKLYEVEEVFL
eukprot:TRINITY_DN4689_c0_g1_i1.p2 TRINITY_DN4689_c0_g1~~TRINITY_DN4689_c0_g1_i1.p2  ORF type:complete len:281 (-),score=65.45 TRINITY_DN4689_c0_g1_i1:1098-1940(-)